MTAAAPPATPASAAPADDPFRYAHWALLVALGLIVAGFWPSFFHSLGTGSPWHTLHGVTATAWVVALVTQAYLMSRGLVRWHRLVAAVALVNLIALTVAALYMVGVMQKNPEMPPFLPPLLAFIDLPSIIFLLVLVGAALRNIRRPAIHKRYMLTTVLLAFPPALTRLYARLFAPEVGFVTALHASFITVDLILVALIIRDHRAGERYLPFRLALAFFVAVQLLMGPVAASGPWQAVMTWYAALPPFDS